MHLLQGKNEKNAMINAIRQSLMQYEVVGKSPGGASPSPSGASVSTGPGSAGPGSVGPGSVGPGSVGPSSVGPGSTGPGSAYSVQSPVSPGSPEPRERWRALQTCGLGAASALYADPARARALVEQQRARLLQMQRSQQMLVSPEVLTCDHQFTIRET